MDAPIQLLGQGNTAGALFSGYPEKVEIKEEKGYRIADIQAVSGTILLDQKKSNRVFQKISFVMMLLRGQACRWGTG